MPRAKRDPETTKAVWWEDLPQDLVDFLDREIDEAEELHRRQQEKRAGKKSEKKTRMVVIQEDEGDADWLKRPSDLIASLNDPKIQTREELLSYLERRGLTGTLLYKRMRVDPSFW